MGLRKALKNGLRQELISRGMTIEAFKSVHYGRNQVQDFGDAGIGYDSFLLLDSADPAFSFVLMSDQTSVLHRLNKSWDAGNARNSKWVAEDGRVEFVFKYVGSAAKGEFRMVTSDLNMGTYNFEPSAFSGGSDIPHFWMDVAPWILWGNTPQDAANWAFIERAATFGTTGGIAKLIAGAKEFMAEGFGFEDGLDRAMTNGPDDKHGSRFSEKFFGKGGTDTVSYQNAPRAVTVNLEKGEGFDGWARGDSFRNIENLTGSKAGDILIGDGGVNILKGLGGRDRLYGGDGNDVIRGGKQDDFIFGGIGDDELYGGAGKNTIYGGFGDDLIVLSKGRDHVIDGGPGWDILDLRGMKESAIYTLDVTGIDELWTDTAFVVSEHWGVSKTKLFGKLQINLTTQENPSTVYLMGGGQLELSRLVLAGQRLSGMIP